MNLPAVITMIVVIGVVWGGVSYFILRAFKYEKEKIKNGEE
jgi:hypothetical protein